jgi:membrane-bound lytic murein transglycosylase D
VASVATRYRVSAAQVAQWNRVSAGASFAPGQTVIVYVAGKATHTAKASGHRKASGHPSTRSAGTARKPVRVATVKAPTRAVRN